MTTHLRETIKQDNPVYAGVAGNPIDWSVLDALKVLQKPGKPDMRKKLLEPYLTSSQALFENASAAVTTADGDALMKAAHSLKSSSFVVGAATFGATCFALEKIGRANTLIEAPTLLNRAENEYSAVCSALRAHLNEIESDAV